MANSDSLPFIDVAGTPRKLGALKPAAPMLASARRFSELGAVDPSTWKECDYSTFGSPIRNQSTHGSCSGHAGVAALDLARRQNGQDPVLLSCTFPYAQVNGGRDNGASVTSILQVLKQLGTCTQEECGTDQIFQNQIPQAAYTTAKKYQVLEAFLCSTFEDLCDAINRGFPTAFGIMVGQNFSRLSPEGIAPPPNRVVGGHALMGCGLKNFGRGIWGIKTQNSWGQQWGQNGFCYLLKSSFDYTIDAYAIQYTEILNPPPVVPKTATTIFVPDAVVTENAIVPVEELPPETKEEVLKEGWAEESAPASVVETPPELPPTENPAPTEQGESLMAQFDEPTTPTGEGEKKEATHEGGKRKNRHKH